MRIIFLLLFSFSCVVSFSQSKKEIQWQNFIKQFKVAIINKDRAALIKMSSPDFFSSECYVTAYGISFEEWIQKLFESNNKSNYYKFLIRLNNKPRDNKSDDINTVPMRTLGSDDFCNPRFEYLNNSRWVFRGFMANC